MKNEQKYAEIAKSLWINSHIISRQLDNSLGAIHGIGLTEYMVLLKLNNAPNNALRRIDIAESLARTASGVTRMLIPMEKIGLVEKEKNHRDARVSLVKMTSTGAQLFKNASKTLDSKSKSILKNLTKHQADSLFELLNII